MATKQELLEGLTQRRARVFPVEVDGATYGIREPSGFLWQQFLDKMGGLEAAKASGHLNAESFAAMTWVLARVLATPEGELLFLNPEEGASTLCAVPGDVVARLFHSAMEKLKEVADSMGKGLKGTGTSNTT